MRRTTWGVLAAAMVLAVTGCAVEGDDSGAAPGGSGSPGPLTSPETPSPTDDREPNVPPDDSDSSPGESVSPRPQPGRPSPVPDDQLRSRGEVPRDYLDAVLADAARRAGMDRSRIQVERDQAVQWRDGSLGCPEPGMMYTQAIVDGYWVELTAGSQLYDYRLDGQGNFRLCEQPLRRPPYTNDR